MLFFFNFFLWEQRLTFRLTLLRIVYTINLDVPWSTSNFSNWAEFVDCEILQSSPGIIDHLYYIHSLFKEEKKTTANPVFFSCQYRLSADFLHNYCIHYDLWRMFKMVKYVYIEIWVCHQNHNLNLTFLTILPWPLTWLNLGVLGKAQTRWVQAESQSPLQQFRDVRVDLGFNS